MLHASTSPFYPLFASLDVGAQMMKGRSGEVLWDDTIRLGIELRKKVRAIRREFEHKESDPARRWFFEAFVPDRIAVPGRRWPARDRVGGGADRRARLRSRATGSWRPAPAWHGFSHVAPGYAITDPNKLTVLTPGFDRSTGAYAEHGIPAPVVAQYLRENRVVPEKNDLNSLLFLLTPGVESSKAGTLLSTLVAFKRLHDDNARLDDVIGDFVRRRPARYSGVRLRDLCAARCTPSSATAASSTLQRAQFAPEHLPTPAMAPHEAVRQLVRNNVDYVPVDEAYGRIATTMFVVYPPGIASIVPGERLDERARPMLDYLAMFERSANLFPGFEVEIQGIYREIESDGTVRFYTYVVRE